MAHNKALAIILVCALGLFHAPVSANNVGIEVNLGVTSSDAQGYSDDASGSLGVAWYHNNWSYRAGLIHLGELELRGNIDNTYIRINGGYLQVNRRLNLRRVAFELGGGLLISSSEAFFAGNRVEKDEDFSPFVEARAIKRLGRRLDLQAGFRYFVDVNGSDLSNPFVGLSVSF